MLEHVQGDLLAGLLKRWRDCYWANELGWNSAVRKIYSSCLLMKVSREAFPITAGFLIRGFGSVQFQVCVSKEAHNSN